MQEDAILNYSEITGVRWLKNVYVPTGKFSGILLGGTISTNVIRQPDAKTEYSVWGIHLATDDQLTFIHKADPSPIRVQMIDCRIGSSTLHNYLEIVCEPDPTKRLIIPRGVAHLPIQVNGLITLNTPQIYWDISKRMVHPDLDVINIEKDRPRNRFPAYKVCRFRVPQILYPAALKAFKSRYSPGYEAPFIFDRHGTLYVLRRKHQV